MKISKLIKIAQIIEEVAEGEICKFNNYKRMKKMMRKEKMITII
jgi:hypothetical protein